MTRLPSPQSTGLVSADQALASGGSSNYSSVLIRGSNGESASLSRGDSSISREMEYELILLILRLTGRVPGYMCDMGSLRYTKQLKKEFLL